MRGNLFFMDLKFVCPDQASSIVASPVEILAFTHVPLSWDLWHARTKPYPPSNEPQAEHMLDLIHSDLCGPFPTMTPHGKLHFIVFLDDHTNLLNIQLLATKDQSLDAWLVIKTRWENHSEHWVKRFHSDNGGEIISAAFT
jgi:hypothetical protein